jgi:hypothetical protein
LLIVRKGGVLPLLPHKPSWRRQGQFYYYYYYYYRRETPKGKHNDRKFGIEIVYPLKQETEVYLGEMGPLEKLIFIRRRTDDNEIQLVDQNV